MKAYETPEILIVSLTVKDIITVSNGTGATNSVNDDYLG